MEKDKKFKKCSFINCKSTSENYEDGFFLFRHHDYKDWIIASGNYLLFGNSVTYLIRNFYVCSLHFSTEDFTRIVPPYNNKLKKTAVPKKWTDAEEKFTEKIDEELITFIGEKIESFNECENELENKEKNLFEDARSFIYKNFVVDFTFSEVSTRMKYLSQNSKFFAQSNAPEKLRCLEYLEKIKKILYPEFQTRNENEFLAIYNSESPDAFSSDQEISTNLEPITHSDLVSIEDGENVEVTDERNLTESPTFSSGLCSTSHTNIKKELINDEASRSVNIGTDENFIVKNDTVSKKSVNVKRVHRERKRKVLRCSPEEEHLPELKLPKKSTYQDMIHTYLEDQNRRSQKVVQMFSDFLQVYDNNMKAINETLQHLQEKMKPPDNS